MINLHSLGARPFGRKVSGPIQDKWIETQTLIGEELPKELLDVLAHFGGASILFDKEVTYRPMVPSKWTRQDGTQSLEVLFGLAADKTGLLMEFNRYRGRVPSGVVPIGEGPGGNLVCLVVRGPTKGQVYFWDHEGERLVVDKIQENYNNMFLIARTLDQFMNSLVACDPEVKQADGVVDAWLADDL